MTTSIDLTEIQKSACAGGLSSAILADLRKKGAEYIARQKHLQRIPRGRRICDRERREDRNKAYYEANKERLKARRRERTKSGVPAAQARARRALDPEKARAREAEYRARNHARIREQKMKWARANRNKVKFAEVLPCPSEKAT